MRFSMPGQRQLVAGARFAAAETVPRARRIRVVVGVLGLAMLAGVAAGAVNVAPARAADGEATVKCEPGVVYTMSASGNINKVKSDGSALGASDLPIPPLTSGVSGELNGLALTKGGTYAYLVRDTLTNGAVTVYRHDVNSGQTVSYPGATGVSAADTTFVLGGIDPVSEIYYYGRILKEVANAATFLELYGFDTTTNTNIGYVGKVAVGLDTSNNVRSSGDLVFDTGGRMHFVAGSGTTIRNSSVFMTVNEPLPRVSTTAATAALPATRLGDYLELNLAADGGTGARVARRVNGIAFDNGYLLVSTYSPDLANNVAYSYFKVNLNARKVVNSTFGEVIGYASRWTAPAAHAPVDMATCQYNNSLTVQKNIVRRFASGDQFRVQIFSGGSATETSSGVTSGSTTGVRTEASATAYSLPLGGTAIKISENATTASNGNLANYTSSYVCKDGLGTVIRDANNAEVRGTGITTSFAFPPHVPDGVHVTCVFTNTPKVAHVTVKKTWVGAYSGDTATFTANTETGTSTAPATNSEVISADFDQGSTVTVAEAMSSANRGTSYTQALACREDVSGAAVTVVAGKFTLGTNDITCTFTNTNTSASVVVDKKWIVDGVAYDNGAQPAGLEAALTLTGPAVADASSPTWGKVRSGYAAGDTVNINETTSIDESLINCRLTDSQVTRANGATVAASLNSDYPARLLAGANSYTITNTVACETRLTLLKFIDTSNGGTLKPSDFTLTAKSESGDAVGVPGVDAVPARAVPVNTMDVTARSPYVLSESSAADLAYIRINLQRYTGKLASDGSLTDPNAWAVVAPTISVGTGQHEVYRFVNASVPRLNLPLTGGAGPARYLLAGGGMLLAAFLLAAWVVVRRICSSSL